MGVIRAHDVPHHFGALGMGSVGPMSLIEHRVEDPPVNRLQAVPDMRQCPRNDDRHGVLEKRALHLFLNLDGLDEARHRFVGAGSAAAYVASSVVACCHSLSLPSCYRPVPGTGAGPIGNLKSRETGRPWRWSE